MAINLQKGQRIEIGLQKVGVGLGWDPNEGTGYDFDLGGLLLITCPERAKAISPMATPWVTMVKIIITLKGQKQKTN